MYGFEYPKGMSVGRVCLEISLKPFREVSDAYIERVCKELFDEWSELLLKASGASVLIWIGDGSEILEYRGSLDDEFEWGRYLGMANPPKETFFPDPTRDALHSWPRYYTDDMPTMTYGILKRIIDTLKRVGEARTGLPVTVGATFDPGPEFAQSDFKYRRHREILQGAMGGENGQTRTTEGEKSWVHCTSRLSGDDVRYAAYPDGIPDGLPFGTFLGAQYRALAGDVGYDYIWFSNGFGYSRDSWSWTGESFDGAAFTGSDSEKTRADIMAFWQYFVEAYPGVRIETRGSNLATGMDIAAHSTPLSKIYEFVPMAPPNSPWAALDAQFGLELAGYMSHIAVCPEEGFLFRFYTHDPWWINSPWFDRYNRSPHDIYLPLTVARLDENLRVNQPFGINFLTADDSFGAIPRRCPVEVTPHLLDAYSHYPDTAGPVTWIYPFDKYHEIGYGGPRAKEVLFGDWFISSAISAGAPLNSVLADRYYPQNARKLAGKTIVLTVVPDADSAEEKAVLETLRAGGDVMLYGPSGQASPAMLRLLGTEKAAPLEGEFSMRCELAQDRLETGSYSDALVHVDILSGGGLDMVATGGSAVCISAKGSGGERAYATFNPNAEGGRLAWLRGSFPSPGNPEERVPAKYVPSRNVMPGVYLRYMLQCFDFTLSFTHYAPDDDFPMVLFSRSNGGMYITGFAVDSTGSLRLSTPLGAPVMLGTECIVEADASEYSAQKWWHTECRAFVRQKARSRVRCVVRPSAYPLTDRRFYLDGLVDAEVTFLKVPDTIVRVVNTPFYKFHYDFDKFMSTNAPFEEYEDGRIVVRHVTGALMISWGTG